MSENQTVVITGANRGIGLAFVKQYKQRGAKVIGVCRSSSEELDAIADQVIAGVDVSDPTSLAMLTDKLANSSVDILINNAGILSSEALGSINYADIEKQLQVNAIGPIRVAEALLEKFANGAKIAMITSRMGSIADNGSGSYYGYRMSKAALNAGSVSLAKDLLPKGIAVAILHPGFVQTEMVGNNGDISPDTAAERLSQRVDGLNLENSGTFWHSNGEVLPW